jgi:hypothetical protein
MATGFNDLLMRQLGVSLLLAIVATSLITPLLLLLYRRRVAILMARKAGESPPPALPQSPSRSALPASERLRRRSQAAVGARARAWFLGFAAQAAVLTWLFAARYASALSAPAMVAALGVFLVPAALVLVTESKASGWTRLLAVGSGLLVLGLWPGPSGELLRAIALLYVVVPMLPLLLFHLRFWRGAAPQVFLLFLMGFSGWVLAFGLVTGALGNNPGPIIGLARCGGLAAGLGLGVWLLRGVAERHARGTLCERIFALDIWWLLYTLVQAFVVGIGLGSGAAVVALLSFPIGRWIAGRALGRMDASEAPPLRLLLLRVFGNSRRSERLFEQLVQAWSPLGSIELIGGADLALQQVSPLDFLAFLTGQLRECFGQAPSEAAARLATPPTRAADGSYPARQTFCHADVWEPTMRRLLAASDAVVMDLRQFQAQRTGCRVELEALARSGSDRPIVLVSDDSTNLPLVRQLLADAGADHERSPWHFVTASGREATTVGRVLDAVGGL